MYAPGLSWRHKHVISFIETFEQNWFRIRKLIQANEVHSAPSVTGGEDRRLVTRGQITSLLADTAIMIIMARKHVRRLTGSPSAPGGGNRRRGEVIMTVPQSLSPSVPDVLMSV